MSKTIKKNISSQVIWIIGASSGIGEALALQYAQQGAKLILSARRKDQLYQVKAKAKTSPMHIHVLPLDLEQTSQLNLLTLEALKIFGRIDKVIHCAGITQRSLAMDTHLDVAQKIMNINYWGPVAITQAILPYMMQSGGGHIVVISSLMGKFSTPLRSSYAASKHALHGYFEALRAETYDKQIRISMVCPGFVHTDLSEKALIGDGNLYGKLDNAHAKAMSAETFVQKLMPKLQRQKEEIFIGGAELKGLWASRYLPGFFRKKIRKVNVI